VNVYVDVEADEGSPCGIDDLASPFTAGNSPMQLIIMK